MGNVKQKKRNKSLKARLDDYEKVSNKKGYKKPGSLKR